EELAVTGRVDSGMIMAMRHTSLPVHSVQFHPESVMTQYGHRMLANWLIEAGFPIDEALLGRIEEEQLAVTGALSNQERWQLGARATRADVHGVVTPTATCLTWSATRPDVPVAPGV